MNDFLKKNAVTLIIVFATIILAGIAVFTAIRLYQLKQQAVAPNAPSSKPAAAANTASTCQLAFTITPASSSPSPSPSTAPQCGTTCTGPSDCPSSMFCSNGVCRNPNCLSDATCACATPSPTPSPTPGAPNSCGGTCGSDTNCAAGMTCYITSGTSGFCRNASCVTDATCSCATATPLATGSATPAPTLPNSGSTAPTIIGLGAGAILLITGIALIL